MRNVRVVYRISDTIHVVDLYDYSMSFNCRELCDYIRIYNDMYLNENDILSWSVIE